MTIREQALAAGGIVEVDRLEWLDQLEKAVEPKGRKAKQMLVDFKFGANNTSADKVYLNTKQVLAVCDMEPKPATTPVPVKKDGPT